MKDNKFALRDLTKEELRQLYFDEKLSQGQIAKRWGVTQGAICYWMKNWRIKARSHDDALILLGKSGRFTGPNNPKWNGGRYLSPNGYVMIRLPKHPKASKRGYVREHLLIWEAANGNLPEKWHIHHKNGIKTDNRLENLQAYTSGEHRLVLPNLLKRISDLEVENERLRKESNPGRQWTTDAGSSRTPENDGM